MKLVKGLAAVAGVIAFWLLCLIGLEVRLKESKKTQVLVTSTPSAVTVLHYAVNPSALKVQAGSGFIEIDCNTGHVRLPADVELDQAALEFWLSVAKAFPAARQSIINGKR